MNEQMYAQTKQLCTTISVHNTVAILRMIRVYFPLFFWFGCGFPIALASLIATLSS